MYNDKQYDSRTGLYYYNARFYDPAVQRFVTKDSYVPSMPDSMALNQYSYVRDSPETQVDPTGNDGECYSTTQWRDAIGLAHIAEASAFSYTNYNYSDVKWTYAAWSTLGLFPWWTYSASFSFVFISVVVIPLFIWSGFGFGATTVSGQASGQT